MAFPPPTLAATRTNATPQLDTHPDDHNDLANAVNDITANAVLANARLNRPMIADRQGVSVSGTANTTTGFTFTGSLNIGSATYDRYIMFAVSLLFTTNAAVDIYIISPGGGLIARHRVLTQTGEGVAFATAYMYAAGGSGNAFALNAKAVTGTATISTSGGADLNYLSALVVPALLMP